MREEERYEEKRGKVNKRRRSREVKRREELEIKRVGGKEDVWIKEEKGSDTQLISRRVE